jgi:ketopantoate reductase
MRVGIECAKAHQTASATRWLQATCGPDSKIAVLQNGIDHVDRWAPIIADVPIIPVIVRCPMRPVAPGRVKRQGPAILSIPIQVMVRQRNRNRSRSSRPNEAHAEARHSSLGLACNHTTGCLTCGVSL